MTSSRDRDRTLVVGRVGAVSGIMREQVGHGLVLMLVYCIYFLYTVYKNILLYLFRAFIHREPSVLELLPSSLALF